MFRFFKKFRNRDDGAVTVDWVVLTAALVGLGAGIIFVIADSATDKSTSVGAHIDTMQVKQY